MSETEGPALKIIGDDTRCRAPINTDGSRTHLRIDQGMGEIIITYAEAAQLRDWLNERIGR